MATDTADLLATLSEKEDLIKKLILLLEEERGCIVAMDVTNLEQVDDRKRQLLVQLEDVNNRSRQIMRQMAGDMSLPESANLSSLLANTDIRSQTELKRLQGRILEQGTALQAVLAFNRDLLQGSLRMVTRSLDFFGCMFKRSTTYGQAGSMVTSPADMRLVCKEI